MHTLYNWSGLYWFGSSLSDKPRVLTCYLSDSNIRQHRAYSLHWHCWHNFLLYITQGWSWYWHMNTPQGREYRLCFLPASSNHCCRQFLQSKAWQMNWRNRSWFWITTCIIQFQLTCGSCRTLVACLTRGTAACSTSCFVGPHSTLSTGCLASRTVQEKDKLSKISLKFVPKA